MAKTRKSKKTLKAFESRLTAEREDLLQQIAELEARRSEDAEATYDEDSVEPETATYERERDFTLLENLRDMLDKVDHALEKITDETFGMCEACGKTIEAARIKVLPSARLCITCQREEERR